MELSMGHPILCAYSELADASGATWTKVHYEVGGHLWRLVDLGAGPFKDLEDG